MTRPNKERVQELRNAVDHLFETKEAVQGRRKGHSAAKRTRGRQTSATFFLAYLAPMPDLSVAGGFMPALTKSLVVEIEFLLRMLTISLLIVAPISATAADPFTLFCRPSNGETWVAPIQIDLEKGEIGWGHRLYKGTYLDDLYIIAVSAKAELGADTLIIERDTGSFWRAGVGRYCTDANCSNSFSGNSTDEGTCRSQNF